MRDDAERARREPPAKGSEVEDAASDPSTGLDSEGSDSDSDSDGEDTWSPFAPEDTILIFDWDDTVLPSTWLAEQGLRLDDASVASEVQRDSLDALAARAVETLSVAKRHGTVVLVTNAEEGWIEMSCSKFIPALLPVLADIKKLSARSTYEVQGVESPFEWKYLAFESEIGSFCRKSADRRKNVISVGDSAHEREALIRVTERLQNCCIKSLKFAERPGVENLLKEHLLISGCFKHIVDHDGNLDLCIRCS
eukprot:SRR837773.3855.p1 GENE.SRR837773.3855~~SRR837773.3855.p1  ORF type:complete len:252 (+),score=73.62 SRR837773.3855:127-882(+)